MNTWSLATRNLLRNRRRSLATLLALAIGATSVLLFGGFSADIRIGLLTSYVQNGGHLQIQHRDYFLFGNGNPTAYGIPDFGQVMEAVIRDPELRDQIKVASPTLQFGGLAGNYEAGVSRTVLGVGYVADHVAKMRAWNEYQVPQLAHPYALLGAPDDAAVVGIGLARVLLLCDQLGLQNCPRPTSDAKPASPGATLPADIAALAVSEHAGRQPASPSASGPVAIELLATQPKGSPNVTTLKVIAAEDQGFKELDEVAVILQLEQAQRLVYGREPARATSIMIQLERTAAIPRVADRIRDLLDRKFPGHTLAVMDFRQLNPFFGETINLFNTIFGFIFILIGGIVIFTVSNTMTAAVVERTTEIGTIRAVGLRQGGIRRLFVTEGFLLGCIGATAGIVLALGLGALINVMNLTWLPPGTSTPLPLTVRVFGEFGMIFGVGAGLIAVATLSAWVPSWRAAKLSIVDALRHA